MKRFGIYVCQFSKDDGNMLANDSTMIGEVDMTADRYQGMALEEAGRDRLIEELSPRKNTGFVPFTAYIVEDSFKVFEFNLDKEDHADSEIHELLKNEGYEKVKTWKTNGSTEIFNLGGNFQTIVFDAIKRIEKNQPYMNFIPRNKQVEVIQKMDEVFKTYKQFLLGAICRFGKTATLLHYFTQHHPVKNILCITAKCDAITSWRDDYRKFTDRSYQFLTKEDLLKNDKKGKSFSDKNICVVSFQSSAKEYADDEKDIDIDVNTEEFKSIGKIVKKNHWDVLIIDECHFGSETKRSTDYLKALNFDLKIDVSATPFKKIENKEYSRDNSFVYDLVDEKKDNTNVNDLSKYVPCEFFHLDFGRFGKDGKFNKGYSHKSIEEQLEKFNSCWNEFTFNWESYFTNFNPSVIGEHFKFMYDKTFNKFGKHFAIYVNFVKNGEILTKAIKALEKFEVIPVCGKNRESVFEINRKLDTSEKPVIIISCGRDLTGVTLTKLDGLIIMGVLNSAENYFQFSLRGKNTYEGREHKCSVFDLNPRSFIQTNAFARYVEDRANYLNQETEKVAKEVAQCFEIFEINDYDNIVPCNNIDQMIHDAFRVKNGSNMAGCYLVNYILEDDIMKDIRTALTGIEYNNQKTKLEITAEQTAGKPENLAKKQKKTMSSNNEEVSKKEMMLAYEKVKKMVGIIPQLMFNQDIKNLDSFINNNYFQNLFKVWTDVEWNDTMQKIHDWLIQQNEIRKWKNLNYIILQQAE